MSIQWFPGHMAAARRQIAQAMAEIDVVVEIVDARAPEASRNPLLAELAAARQRPRLLVLNKADLADPAATDAWLAFYRAQPGIFSIAISAKDGRDVRKLAPMAQRLAPHRLDATKPLRLLIGGIPNVGKSTLINTLLMRRVAKVANEPAVTRQVMRYDVTPRLVVFDTPGMLWPKIESPAVGLRLASLGSIGQNAYFVEEVADFLADYLLGHYAPCLRKRYRFRVDHLDSQGLIFEIGRSRGCLRGERLDREKAARILLDDFRAGLLGRISLELPINNPK
ncbi:MAG: ribosome biogenesis GTPase YlqF [Rhodocyclaceae bacterium]|nr:ribosome biogenesis GTPase YlqF [Rhodocyclaceae bacterium]